MLVTHSACDKSARYMPLINASRRLFMMHNESQVTSLFNLFCKRFNLSHDVIRVLRMGGNDRTVSAQLGSVCERGHATKIGMKGRLSHG